MAITLIAYIAQYITYTAGASSFMSYKHVMCIFVHTYTHAHANKQSQIPNTDLASM
jgi:hypothetical protein